MDHKKVKRSHLPGSRWQINLEKGFWCFSDSTRQWVFSYRYKKYVVVTHDHEADSAIYALERETGKTIWKVDRIGSKPSSSTPMIFEANDGKCLRWFQIHNRTDAMP